ncbi:MAG TPA: DUF790 family protein [Thermomicrobiales bacterium]|nr:DUF790 family protein [Thermomicrobiales bacterium]
MAFRRQDIRKMTRRPKEGGMRRLYPRFVRDRSFDESIQRAVAYLDGMVGQRRGDLAAETMVDLLGDPKFARCILACLADTFHYRTPSLAEAIGAGPAQVLERAGISSATDMRAVIYDAVNAKRQGFVTPVERHHFLAEQGQELNVSEDDLDRVLHLDAERNAVLVRSGELPDAQDIVARYNTTLAFSVLRHARTVSLELPGLSTDAIAAICEHNDTPYQQHEERLELQGGGSHHHGTKLARCVLHLVLLCPKTPSGRAVIDLNSQRTEFLLDAKTMPFLRPRFRHAANVAEIGAVQAFIEQANAARRAGPDEAAGWTIRHALEPIVAKDVVFLPEMIFVRGQTAIPVCAAKSGRRAAEQSPLDDLLNAHRVIQVDLNGVPLGDIQADTLFADLNRIYEEAAPDRDSRLTRAFAHEDWLTIDQLRTIIGPSADSSSQLTRLAEEHRAEAIPGFGICRAAFLDRITRHHLRGPIDIAKLRGYVATIAGDGPPADALTLHLLSRRPLAVTAPNAEAA